MDEKKLVEGDKVWRVVTRDRTHGTSEGPRTYLAEHIVQKVGRKYYTFGGTRDGYQVPIEQGREKPNQRYYSSGYGSGTIFFFVKQDAEDSLWLGLNKYRLVKAVEDCRDVETLKQIEALLEGKKTE
jgi:hypothetical protein